uniref:Lectin_legB domain-containing protein n=1 Tax=Panagrellus redivivus TaxID=6233 RepID=A0A7E4V9W6_PANRE
MLSPRYSTIVLPFLFSLFTSATASQKAFKEPLIEVYEGQNWLYSENNVLFFTNTTDAKTKETHFTTTLLTKGVGQRFTGGNGGVFDGYVLFPLNQTAIFTVFCNRRALGTDNLRFIFGDEKGNFEVGIEMIFKGRDEWFFAHEDRIYGRLIDSWEKGAVNVTFSPDEVRITSFDVDHSVKQNLISLSRRYNLFNIVLAWDVESVCTIKFANNTHYAIPTQAHKDPAPINNSTTTEVPIENTTEADVADAWAMPPAVLPVAILLWIILLGVAIGLGVLHRLHAERRDSKKAVSPSEQMNTVEAQNEDVF